MRLHRLQVTAFGPFAGTEEVDFDRLSESGLFLLHGPTGAGKSSVLDAVCFALYGRVPGARGAARPHLRSDHAEATARPEVRLELTLDGRRFEVARSPEWQRPKKRGLGMTPEKGSVVLRERVGQAWQTTTTRADEAGQLLQDLLGMRLDQFTKVALLPQGEFAAFLRADAESRRSLLEQLFATRRFSDVETWLSERRRALGRDLAAVASRTNELLARADEHAAALTAADPSDWTDWTDWTDRTEPSQPSEPSQASQASQPGDPAGGGIGPDPIAVGAMAPLSAAERLRVLAEEAAELAERAAQDAERATAEAEAATGTIAGARLLAARQARLAELTEQAAGLVAAEPAHTTRREQLARARRAAPLLPLLTATARRQTELEQALLAQAEARSAVPVDLAGAGRLALEAALAERAQELGRLADAREVAEQLAEQQAARDAAGHQAAAADLAARATRTESGEATERRTATLARLDRSSAAAARRPAAEAALADLERIRRAVVAKGRLQTEVAAAAATVTERHEAALVLKERWLTLREDRLAGIASELSATLVAGGPCPVCGAAEHPAPAPVHDRAISEQADRAAQQEAFDADQALASARERLAVLTAGLAEEVERAGRHTARTIKAAVAAAKADLAACVDAADRLGPQRADLAALDGQLAELARLEGQLVAAAAEQRATAKAAAAQVRRLSGRLATLRGADLDIPARLQRVESEAAAITTLLRADDDHSRLAEAAAAAFTECETACAAAGFDRPAEAAAAALPETDLGALALEVERHDELVAGVQAQLSDPDLVGVAGVPAPDLAALAGRESAAATRRRAAEQSHARLESARLALHRLAAELAEHEERSAAVQSQSRLVDDLARCVEGTGGDNVLRMRLSSYVLAARLEEVAAAATERLLVMSDGRYSLVHTDALAKGGIRSGLGLRVVDGWTGVERDTGTLSGGESFLASLALALGLADAVQAEAGGAVLQTLFIDEGFGMLDEETLDEVMTVLDGLREGGRSVGLVSHVADLRTRIPAQLEVRKSRAGSRIVVQDAGAA